MSSCTEGIIINRCCIVKLSLARGKAGESVLHHYGDLFEDMGGMGTEGIDIGWGMERFSEGRCFASVKIQVNVKEICGLCVDLSSDLELKRFKQFM